jgi:hypothetical protein
MRRVRPLVSLEEPEHLVADNKTKLNMGKPGK